MFLNNIAGYGPNIAGIPSKLDIITEQDYFYLNFGYINSTSSNSSVGNGSRLLQ